MFCQRRRGGRNRCWLPVAFPPQQELRPGVSTLLAWRGHVSDTPSTPTGTIDCHWQREGLRHPCLGPLPVAASKCAHRPTSLPWFAHDVVHYTFQPLPLVSILSSRRVCSVQCAPKDSSHGCTLTQPRSDRRWAIQELPMSGVADWFGSVASYAAESVQAVADAAAKHHQKF